MFILFNLFSYLNFRVKNKFKKFIQFSLFNSFLSLRKNFDVIYFEDFLNFPAFLSNWNPGKVEKSQHKNRAKKTKLQNYSKQNQSLNIWSLKLNFSGSSTAKKLDFKTQEVLRIWLRRQKRSGLYPNSNRFSPFAVKTKNRKVAEISKFLKFALLKVNI